MAKIDVALRLLAEVLFHPEKVTISAAVLDVERRVITFEIEGASVPTDCNKVEAVVIEGSRAVAFRAIHPKRSF